jgi:hypothetical protein
VGAPAVLLLSFVAGSAVSFLALATICLAADVTFSMSLSNSPFNGISFVIKPPSVLITSRSAPPGRPRSMHLASAPAAITAVLNCSMFDMLPPEQPRRVPGTVFLRAMPGSGIAAEVGIVSLRFYAAHSMAGSPPVTLLAACRVWTSRRSPNARMRRSMPKHGGV